jgi:hypothetical protein
MSNSKNPGFITTINGTSSSESYAVFARRGSIFFGVKFIGFSDGASIGVPGTTYLHARLRSTALPVLAAKIDAAKIDQPVEATNVINLASQQLTLDKAWPNLPFDKIDDVRASLSVGAFLKGTLHQHGEAVVARVASGELFTKLAGYAMKHAGHEHCIMDAGRIAAWLLAQAAPTLASIKANLLHQKQLTAAQQEFAAIVESQLETFGPQTQLLEAIIADHTQGSLNTSGKA